MASASTSSFARKNKATGPKNSWRYAGFAGVTSVNTVGNMKAPGPSGPFPPTTNFAPFATAEFT